MQAQPSLALLSPKGDGTLLFPRRLTPLRYLTNNQKGGPPNVAVVDPDVSNVEREADSSDMLCYLSRLSKQALRSKTSDEHAEDLADKIGCTVISAQYWIRDLIEEEKVSRTEESEILTVLEPNICSSPERCASCSREAQSTEPTAGSSAVRKPASPVYSLHPEDVKRLSGWDLGHRFRYVLERAAVRHQVSLGPDPFNHRAVAGSFARWQKQGFDSVTIAAMIDCFADDLPRHLRPRLSAWRLFLAARTSLYGKVADAVKRESLTDDDWSGASCVEQDQDWDYWDAV